MRKFLTVVAGLAVATLFVGVGYAFAQSTGPDQPAGPVYACVNPDGSFAYVQHNVHFVGNSEWEDCWDGPGGRQQWTWSAEGEGPAGPAGADGAPGADGADGVSGYEVLNTEERVGTGPGVLAIECPAGKVATGGGFEVSAVSGEGGVDIMASQATVPVQQEDGTWRSTGWEVQYNVLATEANIKPSVHCALAN